MDSYRLKVDFYRQDGEVFPKGTLLKQVVVGGGSSDIHHYEALLRITYYSFDKNFVENNTEFFEKVCDNKIEKLRIDHGDSFSDLFYSFEKKINEMIDKYESKGECSCQNKQ